MSERRSATAIAAANIAFIKYWGASDLEHALPMNPSISMTLTQCHSRCTSTVLGAMDDDEVLLVGEDGAASEPPPSFDSRVRAHLERLRRWAGTEARFSIRTGNSFPAAAGLASSASGFTALTLAVTSSLGFELAADQLSILCRQSGSGSAARSAFGGFVEWPAESGQAEGPATQVAAAGAWDLRDTIAVVEREAKKVSSLEGHRRAPTSPYYAMRLQQLPSRTEQVRRAIREQDFDLLGPVVEEEAIDLHLIAMSSRPPIFYWKPGTLRVLERVRQLRRRGTAAWSTMDAGANVHVISEPAAQEEVAAALAALPEVDTVIRDRVGGPPHLVADVAEVPT